MTTQFPKLEIIYLTQQELDKLPVYSFSVTTGVSNKCWKEYSSGEWLHIAHGPEGPSPHRMIEVTIKRIVII